MVGLAISPAQAVILLPSPPSLPPPRHAHCPPRSVQPPSLQPLLPLSRRGQVFDLVFGRSPAMPSPRMQCYVVHAGGNPETYFLFVKNDNVLHLIRVLTLMILSAAWALSVVLLALYVMAYPANRHVYRP